MYENGKCFVIMPISTPETIIQTYNGDLNHFANILEHLFTPALKRAGFETISPKATGSDIIHAEIIRNLTECELVLCDMSILNPNVFFEFGIRCALNKPVALVVDDKTGTIPFDTGIINFHRYNSLPLWVTEHEIDCLSNHILQTYNKSPDHNVLWKYFGIDLNKKLPVMDLAKVVNAWGDIRLFVKHDHPSIEALLNSGKPIEVRGNDLYLGFQSNKVRELMDIPDRVQIAQKAIKEVLGIDLAIKCVLIKPKI